jgi:peptidylprolyl isomerase
MAQVGDTVQVHYTGTLNNGTVFDSSYDKEPLEFTVGEATLLSDFQKAVVGMQLDQSKTITIPAEDAYGLPEYEVSRDDISSELELWEQYYYLAHIYIPCTVIDLEPLEHNILNSACCHLL